MDADVLVVGAGPAGSVATAELADAGEGYRSPGSLQAGLAMAAQG